MLQVQIWLPLNVQLCSVKGSVVWYESQEVRQDVGLVYVVCFQTRLTASFGQQQYS
jgi:hypothetical protein